MICLSLVADTLLRNLQSVEHYAAMIDLVELRADFLLPGERKDAHRFPARLPAGRDGDRLPAILTVRAERDGGRWRESEDERRSLLLHGLRGGNYRYVDLERWLRGSDRELLDAAAAAGSTVIRSTHDFSGVPADLDAALDGDIDSGEIPKVAAMPRSSAELLHFVRRLLRLRPRQRIVVAMGTLGFPVRVLARRLGSMLTFCSPADGDATLAAPGHVDPQTMTGLYRYHAISDATALFGVVGKPIAHSQSPQYHNRRFAEDQIDAVYLPFEVDDVAAFMELADLLPIDGFSVTIPHKQAIIAHLAQRDPSVAGAGACNTVVGVPGSRIGYNSDVEGFLVPLREAAAASGHPGLDGLRATVIGAGGAARAVIRGLLQEGVRLLLLNRTPERAEALARELGGAIETGALDATAREAVARYADLIVQTTSVGMEPDAAADPIEFYRFHGSEIVYDIVYTPPVTRLLRRAERAGCRTVSGSLMFAAQADAQYRRYRETALSTRAPG